MEVRPVFSVLGLLIAVYVGYRQLMRSPRDGVVRCLGITLLVLALLGPIVWAWYVTWGVVVLAPAALGRLRTALIVISTFWAFAGVTSVHNIYMRMLHTFIVQDLLLVALLLAVAIMPLAQFASGAKGRARLPRLTRQVERRGRHPTRPQGRGRCAGRRRSRRRRRLNRAGRLDPARDGVLSRPGRAPRSPDPRRRRTTSSPGTPLRAPYASA